MADYDWLESEEFKISIGQRVLARAKTIGLNVESSVTFLLIVYLDHYRDENRRLELLKEESKRREQADAFTSVDVLMGEAAENARDRKSNTISMADMRKAHKEKFCMVWPFCGKGKLHISNKQHTGLKEGSISQQQV